MASENCSPTSLPPGPSGLPVVGSMLEYEGPWTNLKWTQRYGPVYHVRMGSKNLVYLNTLEVVEKYMEGCQGEQLLGRPMGPAAFGEGLLFGSGEIWKSNKRAFLKAMHTRTMVEDAENSVQNELTIVLKQLHKKAESGKLFRIGDVLLPAWANSISGFLLGDSLPEGSTDREILHAIVKNLEGVDLTSPLVQFSLKHPKLCEHLKKFMWHELVDIHGTSRRLQRLIGQWIYQIRHGFHLTISSHIQQQGQSATPPNISVTSTQRKKPEECHEGGQQCPLVKVSAPQTNMPGSDEPSSKTEGSNVGVATTKMSVGNNHRAGPVLQKQHEIEDIETENVKDSLTIPSNLMKKFVSSESLLPFKDTDDDSATDTLETQVQFSALGFLPGDSSEQRVKPESLPVLVPTERGCYTTHTDFQRHLTREMSLNVNHHSILHRILAQPEFLQSQDDSELLQSVVDLFFGGVTTVLSGLEFVLMYLSKNPTMQILAQQEVARVMADVTTPGHNVTWSMRGKMPYLRACVVEALRLGCVTPSSLPHVATSDTEIEGYSVPKGFYVLASIYSLHRDPREFADPLDFRPQRHLDAEGNFIPPRSYRPYGIGARSCLGDILAEMELFLFTASILRDFDISSPPGKASEMKTHMRIVHRLENFVCSLRKRKDRS